MVAAVSNSVPSVTVKVLASAAWLPEASCDDAPAGVSMVSTCVVEPASAVGTMFVDWASSMEFAAPIMPVVRRTPERQPSDVVVSPVDSAVVWVESSVATASRKVVVSAVKGCATLCCPVVSVAMSAKRAELVSLVTLSVAEEMAART